VAPTQPGWGRAIPRGVSPTVLVLPDWGTAGDRSIRGMVLPALASRPASSKDSSNIK